MVERELHGCRVLVVEDEYFIADWLRSELADVGAVVLGPVGTVADALRLVSSRQAIDAVLLDVGLQGAKAFPVADLLVARGVPFMFLTGYDASAIPARLQHVLRHQKPVTGDVAREIRRLIHARSQELAT